MHKNITQQYNGIWDEVKELNIARAMGLHRITGEISKDMEKEFKKKFEISDGTYREMKKSLKRKKTSQTEHLPILKRKDSPCLKTKNKKGGKRVKFTEREIPMKICTAITCGRIHARWRPEGSSPNYILGQQKHWLRCSKQCTAIRKSASILRKCNESEKKVERNELINHFDETINKKQFNSMSKKLEQTILTDDISTDHKKKKSKTCTDTEKLLLKTLSKSISTQTDRSSPPELRISSAIRNLDMTNKNIDTFLKADLKRYKKI